MEENDKLPLVACILHLRHASQLIMRFDNEVSSILLSLSKGLLDKYGISQHALDEIEQLEQKIVKQ